MDKIRMANNVVDVIVTFAIVIGVVSAVYVLMPMTHAMAHY